MLSGSIPTARSASAGSPPSTPLISRSFWLMRTPVPVSTRIRLPPASTSSRFSRHSSRPRSSTSVKRDHSGLGTTPKKPPASGRTQPARTTRTRTPPKLRALRLGVMAYRGSGIDNSTGRWAARPVLDAAHSMSGWYRLALAPVPSVLGNTDDRLGGILYPSPGPAKLSGGDGDRAFRPVTGGAWWRHRGREPAGGRLQLAPPNIVWAAERQPQRLMRPRSKSRWYRLGGGRGWVAG